MVIWFSRRWTILWYVVKCLPRAKGCSDRASQHYWPLQWVQKMFVYEDYPVNMTKVLTGIQDLERAVFSCQCKPFAQGHFWCHHCIPWPWKCGFWYTICHTFDILDQLIIRYCVVGVWRPSWKKALCANPTHFRRCHHAVSWPPILYTTIDFSVADKCCYSPATYSQTRKPS